jgi:hypothetical protein
VPSSYLPNKVIYQPVDRHEVIRKLQHSSVLMVAFSALIIETDQAPPILNVDKAILERMSAGFYWLV